MTLVFLPMVARIIYIYMYIYIYIYIYIEIQIIEHFQQSASFVPFQISPSQQQGQWLKEKFGENTSKCLFLYTGATVVRKSCLGLGKVMRTRGQHGMRHGVYEILGHHQKFDGFS